MKSKIQKIILVVAMLLIVAQPFIAQGAGFVFCGLRSQDTPEGAGEAYVQQGQCELSDLFRLVYIIVNYLLGMAGFVALFFVVWGGVQMLLAAGDTTKITNAKQTITRAILGLIITMGAYLIVGWVAGLLLPDSTNPLKDLSDFIS